MLITTQTETKYGNVYNIFDTDKIVQYWLSVKNDDNEAYTAIRIGISTPTTIDFESGIMAYEDQEAISFWNQLSNIEDERQFNVFMSESLNKAIQKLEMKGNENED